MPKYEENVWANVNKLSTDVSSCVMVLLGTDYYLGRFIRKSAKQIKKQG